MKLLLDTCTFLWMATGSPKLSKKAKRLFLNSKNEVYLSIVSDWEIILKYQLKRLPLPDIPEIFIPEQCRLHAIESLPLNRQDVFELTKLPNGHDDPFDRMLVCQARTNDMVILTPDAEIADYPVKTAW